MQEFFIPSDGIKLHVKLEKPQNTEKCPLAIVIHGFTGHMEERHIVEVSQAMNEMGIATLRVEMYGHGKSEGRFEDHTLYKWVTGALAVVDYAKTLEFVDSLYLCGHSQGGLLTMLVAGMKRDDFKAIIPLAPAWMIPDGARQGNLVGQSFDPEHIPDMIEFGGLKLNGNYIRVAQTIHVEDEIQRYTSPVLIVQGDADEAVPLQYARRAAELYANAKLVIVPGDTHCYDHHLEMVTGAVRDFLAEHK
ncbi:alpha/beta hydrolase [Acutalibacter sp. 1XD8-36]|uniref:alpha/beta hydrolase n=1 Tax=Acutalibacter sp. 1XD8-36 TaxID=2320852 RepID=UPI00141297A2|nr:alpha/beta fold hydrolase [Acutalibacter sp. 1XD8-36]NBJ88604.1 alpha/beta fold hydrolase [Acutalibacter sp. 1XD8-36]